MDIPLAVTAAVYGNEDESMVSLIFNDGSTFAIYPNDGSPRTYAHDLLDAWLADGNEIARPSL